MEFRGAALFGGFGVKASIGVTATDPKVCNNIMIEKKFWITDWGEGEDEIASSAYGLLAMTGCYTTLCKALLSPSSVLREDPRRVRGIAC